MQTIDRSEQSLRCRHFGDQLFLLPLSLMCIINSHQSADHQMCIVHSHQSAHVLVWHVWHTSWQAPRSRECYITNAKRDICLSFAFVTHHFMLWSTCQGTYATDAKSEMTFLLLLSMSSAAGCLSGCFTSFSGSSLYGSLA